MSDSPRRDGPSGAEEFSKEAEKPGRGLLAELWQLIREERKWWIAPIVIVLLVIGVLIVLSTTAAAPFIYSLF